MVVFKRKFYRTLYDNNLISYEHCTDEENQKYANMRNKDWPDDVDVLIGSNPTVYIRYVKSEIPIDELKLFVLAKINDNLKTIKNCVIFFVILAIIGIILGIVGLAQLSSAIHSASTSLVS